MSPEKLAVTVIVIIILCLTGLVSQYTHSIQTCRVEAIKAGKTSQEVGQLCKI